MFRQIKFKIKDKFNHERYIYELMQIFSCREMLTGLDINHLTRSEGQLNPTNTNYTKR